MTLVLGLLTSGLSALLELFLGAAIAKSLFTLLKNRRIRKAGDYKVFELQIWLPGQGALRDLIKAESLQQAIHFAKNRYPGCLVEVPQKAAKLRPLSKSSNGVNSEKQRKLRVFSRDRN